MAIVTALISAFTLKKVPSDVAFTGEVTLRGNVLPIGGLKEKSLGASRCGIKKIFIPRKNNCDLDDIPIEIKKNIEYIQVDNYMQVYEAIFGE